MRAIWRAGWRRPSAGLAQTNQNRKIRQELVRERYSVDAMVDAYERLYWRVRIIPRRETGEGTIGMLSIPWYARIAVKMALKACRFRTASGRRSESIRTARCRTPIMRLRVFDKHLVASGFNGRSGLIGLEMGPGDSASARQSLPRRGIFRDFFSSTPAITPIATSKSTEIWAGPARVTAGRRRTSSARGEFRRCLDGLRCDLSDRRTAIIPRIPAASVDLIFSQAVLEHVRRHEFAEVAAQMHRILKPDGIASHQVDLRDHLGGGLNNMRIASRWWETELMAGSGFYTNRIRFSEMSICSSRLDFTVEMVSTQRWDEPPISSDKLAPEFRHFAGEDLLISSFHVLLRRRAG